MSKKKKNKEYKRNSDGKEDSGYLNEQQVRAIVSNELTNMREPMRLAGGSIQAGDKLIGTGLVLGKNGIEQGSDPSIQGWGNTMTFSAIDADTVSWTSGTITLTDGSIYNIETGNTGNMSARTYIYFDINISATALQITTTQATAVGRGKILVATAKNATNQASFQVFGGTGGLLVPASSIEDRTITASKILADSITANEIAADSITASEIAANTITANEIAANTITASQLSVSQLSAISANLGTITAGTIIGANIQSAATGDRVVVIGQAIYFNNGEVTRGYIRALGATGSLLIDADSSVDIVANDYIFNTYDDVAGTGGCGWFEGATGAAMTLDTSKDLIVANDIYADNYFDYAEFFESTPEYSAGIPVGTTVVLEEDLVRPAFLGEIPFGAVSGSAAIILNGGTSDAGRSWGKKYLTDDFGQKIFVEREHWYHGKADKKKRGWSDEIAPPKGAKKVIKKVQVVNPEWDEAREFVPRKKRPEWNKVGLLGRVRLRRGQPVAPNWIKLKNISEDVEEWLIR